MKRICAAFGDRPLKDVRPSEVRSWTAALKAEGLADSTVYALHARLGHLFRDAVPDGLIPESLVSRWTSPPAGKQRDYIAPSKQVWALHEAMPDGMKNLILLGRPTGCESLNYLSRGWKMWTRRAGSWTLRFSNQENH